MELDVVVDEETHPLDDVRLLRDLTLVVQEGQHDRLHDVEEELALRGDVVVKAADLDADPGGDVAEGGRLKTVLIEKVERHRPDLPRRALPTCSSSTADNVHRTCPVEVTPANTSTR